MSKHALTTLAALCGVAFLSSSCVNEIDGFDSEMNGSLAAAAVNRIGVWQAENYSASLCTDTRAPCPKKTEHLGYSGAGYVRPQNSGGYLEWNNINVTDAGEYRLVLRYSNGDTINHPASILVNGVASGAKAFPPTGSWTSWTTSGGHVVVALKKGVNKIRLQARRSVGGPNLDEMVVFAQDLCPDDPGKTGPGQCGCNRPETPGCGAGGKAVLRGEFPLTAVFRNGPKLQQDTYEKWRAGQPIIHGHLPDLITYPLAVHSPGNLAFANRFAAENPGSLMLSTWRAASGTPANVVKEGDELERSRITFPGHWVLYPGTTLAAPLAASDKALTVTASNKLTKGPALLVETSSAGAKLWDRFEYVRITNISGNTVTVQRAFNGSPAARSFPASRTYVARIASDPRTRQPDTNWTFNITASCPKDPQGKTASDILLAHMVDPMKSGGTLEHFGGLDLASGPFGTDGPEGADYDCNGTADASSLYVQGINSFFNRAWSRLGSGRAITMRSDNLNLLGLVNGANVEGLAGPRDPWRDVTLTVNEALAWKKLSDLPPVHLAFVQYATPQEDLIKVQLQRLLSGYSACLGMAAAIPKDRDAVNDLALVELFKGTANEAHWLGKAQGSVKRAAALTPNLLGGKSPSDWGGMLRNIGAVRGSVFQDGGELVVRPSSGSNTTVELHFNLPTRSDFTVLLEAKSEDTQRMRQILEPSVSVPVETKPLRANISNLDYLPVSFYARNAGAGNVVLELRFAEGGDVRFRSLSVHAAPDALACEFEKGVVLVNPSLNNVSLDLTKLFPGRTGYRRLDTPTPAGTIPTKYMPQYTQTRALNSGQTVGNPASVVVPQRNALFLIAQ